MLWRTEGILPGIPLRCGFFVICVTNLKLRETCSSCYCSSDYLSLSDCPRGTYGYYLKQQSVSTEVSGCAGDWAPSPQWH